MRIFFAWVIDAAFAGALFGFIYWLLWQPALDEVLWVAIPFGLVLAALYVFRGRETLGRRLADRFVKSS